LVGNESVSVAVFGGNLRRGRGRRGGEGGIRNFHDVVTPKDVRCGMWEAGEGLELIGSDVGGLEGRRGFKKG
jgi:hypothetical protein